MVNLIIVHDKKSSDIAQQLNALISTIPECQSRVLDEDHWKDNRSVVSSEQHVLYMGNISNGNAIRPIMRCKYEKKNIKYGWIGTKGILSVDSCSFKTEDAAEIKNMLEEQNKTIEERRKKPSCFYSKICCCSSCIWFDRGWYNCRDILFNK